MIRISIEDWLVSFLLLGSKLIILYYDIVNFENNYSVLFFLADIVVLYLLKSKGDKKKAFVLIFIYSLYGYLGLINIYFIIDKININQLILQLVDILVAFYLLYTSFRIYKSVSKGDKIIEKMWNDIEKEDYPSALLKLERYKDQMEKVNINPNLIYFCFKGKINSISEKYDETIESLQEGLEKYKVDDCDNYEDMHIYITDIYLNLIHALKKS